MSMAIVLASGVALAATLEGTDQDDTINGTDSGDSIRGKWGDDTINGKGGHDIIHGDYGRTRDTEPNRSNRDTIDAGPGADRIEGGDQADIIRAGPLQELDADTVLGQHGIDTIDVANYPAFLDTVDCDGDQDWEDYAIADPLDSIAADCENVLRVSERSSTRVKGYLQRPSTPYLEFDSYQETGLGTGVLEGGHPYDKETTSVITLDDDALPGDENRISIKLTVNPEAKTIKQRVTTAQGASKKLSNQDRQAIEKAGYLLTTHLDRNNKGDCDIKNQESATIRHFARLAEAPKGYDFEDLDKTYEYTDTKCNSDQNGSTKTVSAKGDPGSVGAGSVFLRGVAGSGAALRACPASTARGGEGSVGSSRLANPAAAGARYVPLQNAEDEGIDYLSCGADNAIGCYSDEDGAQRCSQPIYGPVSNEQPGTCGPSESYFLEFGYTQDCLDHDICVQEQGGSAIFDNPACNDEFDAAVDDTLFSAGVDALGPINCDVFDETASSRPSEAGGMDRLKKA